MDRPRSPAMSAPPVTSYVRTPPRKSLIYKPFENRPSLILLVLVLALSAGHPCGVPPRLRRGSPSGIKCPPQRGGRIGSPRLRGLRPCPAGRCPSGLPALAAVRLGGQAGGLRPSTAPTRIGWVVSVASRPSRCAVAARALTRLPLGVQPASEARRPKAEGFSLLKKLKLGGARPKAAQLEPVGMWAKAGEPVGNPCGQARGQAQPVHQLVQQGCPRAERSEPAGGRLRPSSTYQRAGKGAKRPRRAKPGEQARRALQPAQPVTTLRSKV